MWWVYVVAEVSLGCFDTLKQHKGPKGLVGRPGLNTKVQEVVFSNMTVEDKYKYDVVPMKDVSFETEADQNGTRAERVNSANVVCVNGICSAKYAVCENGICTIPFNVTDDNQTDIATPGNQKDDLKHAFAKFFHLNKSTSVNISPFLFLLIVVKAGMGMIHLN